MALAGLVVLADAMLTQALFSGGLPVIAGALLTSFGMWFAVIAPSTHVLIHKDRHQVMLERSGVGFRLLEPLLRLVRHEERSLEQFQAIRIESVTDSDGGLTHRLGLAFTAQDVLWLESDRDTKRLEKEVTSGLIAEFLGVGLDGIERVERREQ